MLFFVFCVIILYMNKTIKQLTEEIIDFVNKRDWMRFNTVKNLAVSLSIESAEVLEHVQWKNDEGIMDDLKKDSEPFGEELADVAIYLFELAYAADIDLTDAILKKIIKNGIKYPVENQLGEEYPRKIDI